MRTLRQTLAMLSIACLGSFAVFAQPTIQWQKSLGGTISDRANSVQQTNDGGFIVAGQTNSNDIDVTNNHGGFDAWVVKLNATGTIVWQKALGGTSIDEADSVQQTSEGGYRWRIYLFERWRHYQ